MKKYYAWGVYIPLGLALASSITNAAVTTVVDRGPHDREVVHVTETLGADRQMVSITNSYTELATGMHYQDENGEWLESREIIDIVPGGALASKGQHQVAFAANINTFGAINMVTPDGKRLRSHVLGLAYTDAKTGGSILFAQVQDSIGELVGDNQIIYRDAFASEGFTADIQYIYTRAALQQNIILRPGISPPPPAMYGLDPATTRLEVFTEFVEAPAPQTTQAVLESTVDPAERAAMASPDFVDQSLDFGTMQMSAGRAFQLGDDTDGPLSTPIGKTWEQREGRTVLIEAAQYPAIKQQLDALGANAANNQPRKAVQMARAGRVFPAAPAQARKNSDRIQMAALPIKDTGFVMDYTLGINGATNFTFAGDTTYFLSGSVTLQGSNNVLEGGTVIKQTNNVNVFLRFVHGLICRTAPYRPAILTSMHDDTVGEAIIGSTGNPTNYCGHLLYLGTGSGGYFNIHDVHLSHGARAIYGTAKVKADISNVQITHSQYALKNNQSFWTLRNILINGALNAFDGTSPHTNDAEHITFYAVSNFLITGVSAPNLTNSLLIGVTNGVSYNGTNVQTNSIASGAFQRVGFGAFYLATNSPYRDAGTTNINGTLLTELRQRTTYPPVILSNTTSFSDLTLAPSVSRDSDPPDLGYHYEALDYLISGLTVTNATLLVTNGAAIAWDYSAGSWGILFKDSKFLSTGNPVKLNRLVRGHMVQEASSGNPGTRAFFYDGASVGASNEVRMRFTFCAQAANDGYMVYTGQKFSALEWTHSAIYNPSLVVNTAGGNYLTCGATNTVWERGGGMFGLSSSSANSTVHVRNNLYRNFYQHFIGAQSSWTVHDNLVDMSGLDDHGTTITNSHNAYYLAITNLSGGTSNITLTNLTYVVGPLADYYQPTNSNLLNAGSTAANLVALYHFTCTTNQVKETNSIVDIGPHWVALDSNGSPIDYDGDGLPDYYEDSNGNGSLDSGEIDWQNASDLGLRVRITEPKPSTNLP